jgi:heme/copper-type cytochrome/quinol oxidase subunit 2
MLGELVLFAIAFSIILNYFIISVLTVLPASLGAEGPIKHLMVVATFAMLVFTLGVFVWLTAKFLKLR